MITMTRSLNPQSAQRKYRTATRIALIVAFWIVAALLVAIAHQMMAAASPVISVAVETMAIVAVAGAYIRLAMPHATLDHALFAGTTWVLLGIAAEIIMTANSGHQWFALLGSPGNGGLRCVLLIAWILAPSLFITSRE
jgi:hypothetical protein